jgi:hypothetical protein
MYVVFGGNVWLLLPRVLAYLPPSCRDPVQRGLAVRRGPVHVNQSPSYQAGESTGSSERQMLMRIAHFIITPENNPHTFCMVRVGMS